MWDITLKMMGSRSDPTFKAKAGELEGLLGFCVWILEHMLPSITQAHGEDSDTALRCELLLASGQAAARFDKLLHSLPQDLSHGDVQSLLTAYIHLASLLDRAGSSLNII